MTEVLMLWKSSEKHKWYRYLTLFSFTSICIYGRTECLFFHSFFWVKASFLLGSYFRTGKPLLFGSISPINHLFFRNPTSFSLSIDIWIASSPSCPAVHWRIMAGASFRLDFWEPNLKWPGRVWLLKGRTSTSLETHMCWVTDLWLSSWLVTEVARGSPQD